MKGTLNLYKSILAITLMLFSACNSSETPVAEEDTEAGKPVFTANPQPVPKQEVPTLEIGATAPDFNLPATDGKFYTLNDFKDAAVLAIIFTCNHCPTAQAYESRIIKLVDDYKEKSVQLIAVSPNSPLGLLYEELGYTDLNDDYDEMIIRAEYLKYNFPYLYDGDDEAASLKYGPVATPHAFVFDKERKLQYTGRLDKVEKPGAADAEDLRAAIDAVLEGKTPEIAVTKTFGCSTKWAWKTEMKEKTEKEWNVKEVSVSTIDEDGIKALLKNENSKKLRLINVWATWCGPCVIEYPEFIVIKRMYDWRDFEFISISADKPDQEAKVLEFLQKNHSAVDNYLFAKEDKYALIDAFGDDWNGALPYTVLVEPGGKVVWSHQGEVDFLELKRTIVEHPMIGRYY